MRNALCWRSRSCEQGFVRMMRREPPVTTRTTLCRLAPGADNTYTTWEARRAYSDQLLRKASATPEVVSAALSTNATPPNTAGTALRDLGEAVDRTTTSAYHFHQFRLFSVLPHSLLQGRTLDESETMHGSKLASDQSDACSPICFRTESVGSQIRLPQLKGGASLSTGGAGSESWFQVVGIVAMPR